MDRWGDSQRDRQELDNWITREQEQDTVGHDIYAYELTEVAYLRRSAFYDLENHNVNRDRIYSYLNAEQYNGGVSGTGEVIYFSKDQVAEALIQARKDNIDDDDDLREFLEKALDACIGENGVCIYFG